MVIKKTWEKIVALAVGSLAFNNMLDEMNPTTLPVKKFSASALFFKVMILAVGLAMVMGETTLLSDLTPLILFGVLVFITEKWAWIVITIEAIRLNKICY